MFILMEAANWLRIKNRNRIELRWLEDLGWGYNRMRNRLELVAGLLTTGPVKAFYTNSELFYDFNRGMFRENRWIPAGVRLGLTRRLGLKLYYMVQSYRTVDVWRHNHVFGTHVLMSF